MLICVEISKQSLYFLSFSKDKKIPQKVEMTPCQPPMDNCVDTVVFGPSERRKENISRRDQRKHLSQARPPHSLLFLLFPTSRRNI
jgi:hypothetical protein